MGYGRLALVKFSIHLIILKKGLVQFGDFFHIQRSIFGQGYVGVWLFQLICGDTLPTPGHLWPQ